MSNICVFFEVQGFYLNDRFEPREMALLSASSSLHSAIDHYLKNEDIPVDCVWAVKEMTDHHGLSFEPDESDMAVDQMYGLIRRFYNANRNADKFLVGYSSDAAGKILRSIRIPRVKIPIESLDDITVCHLHPGYPDFHCALGYVQRMFLENKKD